MNIRPPWSVVRRHFEGGIMVNVGDPAPDFELLSDRGEPVKLSDLRGQRVVLFFYPKADTPGCTKQACGFRDNFPRLEGANTAVFGISPDKPESLAQWREKINLPYTLLSDPDHQVAEAYGVWGEKSMYGRKYTGIIRSHFVVDAEGKVEDAQVNVSPEASVERALAAVAGNN
jgi:thioredoxin-dependent peroxiredoxin